MRSNQCGVIHPQSPPNFVACSLQWIIFNGLVDDWSPLNWPWSSVSISAHVDSAPLSSNGRWAALYQNPPCLWLWQRKVIGQLDKHGRGLCTPHCLYTFKQIMVSDPSSNQVDDDTGYSWPPCLLIFLFRHPHIELEAFFILHPNIIDRHFPFVVWCIFLYTRVALRAYHFVRVRLLRPPSRFRLFLVFFLLLCLMLSSSCSEVRGILPEAAQSTSIFSNCPTLEHLQRGSPNPISKFYQISRISYCHILFFFYLICSLSVGYNFRSPNFSSL